MKYNFDEDENSDDDAMIVSGVPASMRDQSDDDDFNANDDDDEAAAKADSDSDDGFAARIKKKLQAEKAAATKKAVPEKKY